MLFNDWQQDILNLHCFQVLGNTLQIFVISIGSVT